VLINPSNTQIKSELHLNTQSVPRSKRTPSQL